MIYAFFVLGGLWFWILSAIAFFLLLVFVEDENAGAAVGSVVVYLLLIHLFGDAAFISYIKANPESVITVAALYFMCGALWGIAKYYFVLSKHRPEIKKVYAQYKAESQNPESVAAKREFKAWAGYYGNLSDKACACVDFARSTKSVIFWAAYWPISFIITLFSDIIKNIWEYIYENWLIGVFKSIHNQMIGKILQ